jgi:hypothetical protein
MLPCRNTAGVQPETQENSVGQVLKFDAKKPRPSYFLVTITYLNLQRVGRVYTDLQKAQRFAERHKKSPGVKTVRVSPLPKALLLKDSKPKDAKAGNLKPKKSKHRAPQVLRFGRASSAT